MDYLPMGVVMALAVFIMKVHRGWDLPQMVFGMIARDSLRSTVFDGFITSLTDLFVKLVKLIPRVLTSGGAAGGVALPHHPTLGAAGRMATTAGRAILTHKTGMVW
jgi:hypothetical protein